MTLSPTNSRWSSLVFFSVLLHWSHAYSFLFYFFCILCIQFIANLSVNSLQILVRSYLSSKLMWQVFSLWWTRTNRFASFGQTKKIRCHRRNQLGQTDFNAEKSLYQLHFAHFVLAPLDDSYPLPASYSMCCFALWLKDQTYFDSHSRRPFLEIDVKGGERVHIKA